LDWTDDHEKNHKTDDHEKNHKLSEKIPTSLEMSETFKESPEIRVSIQITPSKCFGM